MDKRTEKGIECIEMGDKLYSICRIKYLEFQKDKIYMASEEIDNLKRLLGSQLGLVCEYYLKGLLLPYLKFSIPEDANELKIIVKNLTPEQEYNLIIGNNTNTIVDELSKKYNKPFKKMKKIINPLLGQSLKKIGGNGHDLSSFIGTILLTTFRESKLPTSVRKEIYKGMESYFSSLENPKNEEEWKKLLKDFFIIKGDELNGINEHEIKFEQTIEKDDISNAFFSGRYGHLDDYIPNLDALYCLAKGIRNSIKKQYCTAINITDGILDGYTSSESIRYIFPDENSKLYIFDGGKTLTRVYTIEKVKQFLLRKREMNDEEQINRLNDIFGDQIKICPEFGAEKIKELSMFFESDIEMIPTACVRVKKQENTAIICNIDNKKRCYIYRNGKIFEGNQIEKFIPMVEDYETNREKGMYLQDSKRIEKFFYDKKDSKKRSMEYYRYLEKRIGSNEFYRKSNSLIRKQVILIAGANLTLKGARFFSPISIITGYLLEKAKKIDQKLKDEIRDFEESLDKKFNEIELEDKRNYEQAERNLDDIRENLLVKTRMEYSKAQKRRPTNKEFEERVSPYILLDAYEDKHGIGKQLLAKVKNIFGKEEEK